MIEPLAAIEKFKERGASKTLTSIIECESLFNDGIAVTILVFVKSMLQKNTGKNIALLVLSEVGGAIVT